MTARSCARGARARSRPSRRGCPWSCCTAVRASATISARSPRLSTTCAWSLALLLDAWGHDRVVLMGHSSGTNIASYFLLAHPERVAGLIQLAGPFLDPWRQVDQAAQRARRSGEQQARLDELDAIASRTDAEEIEYLTLSWFTDHADRARAWDWALAAARTLRPVNYAMNAQLNAAKKTDALEAHLDGLRELLPPGSVIIGGAGDTRPAAALSRLGARLDCEVIIIPNAGHEPWREAPEPFAAVLRAAAKANPDRYESDIRTPRPRPRPGTRGRRLRPGVLGASRCRRSRDPRSRAPGWGCDDRRRC
jgi:pimeloyl-ACP methyl ester carboxylesterase